jgi:hypothetical protein
MSESDEVELHHLSGLAAAKNDDSDDSGDELIPTKSEMELTHAEVQKYLDEEKQARKERMMENEDPESDDETGEKTAGFSIDDRRNRYGKNKRGNMSAAQTEEMESLALQEALEKKQEQERLVCEMEFEDPELENDDNELDSAEETPEKTTKPSETDENSHPEVEKYLKIYQEIDEIELPKLEKIISENLTALKDAKTLVEFIDIKHSLLVDFKLAILFYLNLELAGTKNLQFHPVTPRLKRYQEIYDSYKIRGSDFQTLNELLESVVEQENESSDEDEEDTSNIEKIKLLENAKSKQTSSDILSESRKSKKAQKVKELEVTAEAEAEKSVKTVEEEDDDDKRGITKDMEKSKGHIVSKKKKIDRNPRVKNREKARVANWKHRKIHGVRKPKGRYDGEYSGINTSAVTSRKF